MTKIIALLILSVTGLFAQSNNPVSLVVTGHLYWVVTTNWSKAGATSTLLGWNGEGENPNVITWHESGITVSNLYFGFEAQGKAHAVLLQSEWFGPTVYRSYTFKTDKVYSK